MGLRCLMTVLLGIFLSGCSSTQQPDQPQNPKKIQEVRITPDVVYGHKFGMALTFDLFQPQKQNGAGIIFINSGGWHSPASPNYYSETVEGHRLATDQELAKLDSKLPWRPRIKPLLDKCFTVFVVRHGDSDKFKMPEIVSDIRRAVRFIRFHAGIYGIDAERLGVWGGSAGGHLALLAGTTADIGNRDVTEEFEKTAGTVAAVVAYFPPAVLQRPDDPAVLKRYPALDLTMEQAREFSPLNFVSPDDAPTLILHGDRDPLVPIALGKHMHQALLKAGVQSKFVTFEGAGHGFLGKDDDRAMQENINWFEEHLVGKSERATP